MAEIIVGVVILIFAIAAGIFLNWIGRKWKQPMLKTFGLVVVIVAVVVVTSLAILN